MRKNSTLLACSLSFVPFAFWELEGPFGEKPDNLNSNTRKLIQPIQRLNKNSFFSEPPYLWKENPYGYLFLYNPQTGYSISYQSNDFLSTKTVGNFFLGNNDPKSVKRLDDSTYGFEKVNRMPPFYFVREAQDVLQEGSTEPNLGSYFCCRYYLLTDKDSFVIKKMQEFISISKSTNADKNCRCNLNIVINSEEEGKVKIRKNNPSLDFQPLLIKYFDKEKRTQDFIKNMIDSIQNKEGLSARILNNLKLATRIGEGEINRLKNSTILAVYAVIKNEKNQDAIIWGLAEDKNDPNKRRFHWITDLEDDFSALLNQ